MVRVKRKTDPICTSIQKAFKRTGWSILKLSKQAGLGYATVYDAITHGSGLTTESAARLLKALDLEIKPAKKRKKG